MDYVNTSGSGENPLAEVQPLAMEKAKFFPTDVFIPLLLLALVTYFQLTSYTQVSILGLLAAVPLTAAIFGKPRMVSLLSTVALIETAWFCITDDSEINSSEDVLFLLILFFSLIAIATSNIRIEKDKRLAHALKEVTKLEIYETVASTDWLTGQLNRRGISIALSNSPEKFQSVVMFDIDGLKKVNDVFGHLAGDDFVKNISARIAANFKANDVYGRWGGDEFIAILPWEEARAVEIVNRVISEVQRTPIEIKGSEIDARISAGVATWSVGADLDDALKLADQALYRAKAGGGGQVVGYSAAAITPD